MASSIEVAEEGNRRRGDMSLAEVEQCVLDITTWFESTGQEIRGAPGAMFQRLSKALDVDVPEELRVLMERQNGGVWFYETQGLSVEGMIDVAQRCDFGEGVIPLAADPDDNMLVVHTAEDDAVYEWDASDGLGRLVAPSLCSFLEQFRQDLLSARYEFIEDCGVVEKAGGGGESKK